jgi:probable F420-dependent oxidoreductase
MKIGVTMPMVQQPITAFADFAVAAEDAGFDSVWDYEVFENPFVVLATAAARTSRIQLGTGIASALARTPFEMANAAADVDALSGGRMLLGVGLGIPGLMATLHGADVDHPLARMREYGQALRAALDYLRNGTPADLQGRYYRFTTPPMPLGTRSLPGSVPIYLGGMNPKMIQVAGELGDGLVGGGYSPYYIHEYVLPNLAIGAERSGRTLADLDLISQTICCVHDDRAEAMRRARIHVGQMVANPVSDGITTAHGFERHVAAIREAMMTGGVDALTDAVDDRLVDTFSISGTPDECRAKLKNYQGLVPHIMLHPPYMPPLSRDETEDAYRNILATFAR